jgi:hypothetical protein
MIAELVEDRMYNCPLHLLLRVVGDVFLPTVRDMFLEFAGTQWRTDLLRRGDLLFYQKEQMDLLQVFFKDHCKKAGNMRIIYSHEKKEWLFLYTEGNKLLDLIAAPKQAWLAAMQHLNNHVATVHVIKAWHNVYTRMLEWDITEEQIARLEQETFLVYIMASATVAGRSQRTNRQGLQAEALYEPPFPTLLRNYAHIHMYHMLREQIRRFGTMAICSMQLVEYVNQRDHVFYNCTSKQVGNRCGEILLLHLRVMMTPVMGESLHATCQCGQKFIKAHNFAEHQKTCSRFVGPDELEAWPSEEEEAQKYLRENPNVLQDLHLLKLR